MPLSPSAFDAPVSPSNRLDVLGMTCPMGELLTTQDRHHVLYFHVGNPVRMTCRLGRSESYGGTNRPGDLFVLPAGITGQWTTEAPADSLMLRLSPSLVNDAARDLRLKAAHGRLVPALPLRDPHLQHIGWVLRAERAQGYPYGRVFIDSLASAIAARLLQRSAGTSLSVSAPDRRLPKWRLNAVCDYIRANLDCDLSLAELAAVSGFSVSHFKPLFRRAVGLPVHRYVVECRVERARQLLLRGDQLMSDIATEAGFSHQTHMARCVRRVLGIGPADVMKLGGRIAGICDLRPESG